MLKPKMVQIFTLMMIASLLRLSDEYQISVYDSSKVNSPTYMQLPPEVYDLEIFSLSFWILTMDVTGTARRSSALYSIDTVVQVKIAPTSDQIQITELLGNTVSHTHPQSFVNQKWDFVFISYTSPTITMRVGSKVETFAQTSTKLKKFMPQALLGDPGKLVNLFQVALHGGDYNAIQKSIIQGVFDLYQTSPSSPKLMQYLIFYDRQTLELVRDFSPYGMASHCDPVPQIPLSASQCNTAQPILTLIEKYNVISRNDPPPIVYLKLDRTIKTVTGYEKHTHNFKQITIDFWFMREIPATPTGGHDYALFELTTPLSPNTIKIKHVFTTVHIMRYQAAGYTLDVTTPTMNANSWYHCSFGHKFSNENAAYGLIDITPAYDAAPTTVFAGGFLLQSIKFGNVDVGAASAYYAHHFHVWTIYRPPQEVIELKFRDFAGYMHPNLISHWNLQKRDLPDGLIVHDSASFLSLTTTSTDYGGIEFNSGAICPYIEPTCGSDPTIQQLVFKDANHYDVEINFGGGAPPSYAFEYWFLYNFNIDPPPTQASPLVTCKDNTNIQLLVQKDPTPAYERLIIKYLGANQAKEMSKRKGNWAHFRVDVYSTNVKVYYNTGLWVSATNYPGISGTYNIQFSSSLQHSSLIYTFREVKLWNRNTLTSSSAEFGLNTALNYFKHQTLNLNSFDNGQLLFFAKFVGEDNAMVATMTAGVGPTLNFAPGDITATPFEAPATQLKLCQLGMRFEQLDNSCSKEDRELYLSEPQNGNQLTHAQLLDYQGPLRTVYSINVWFNFYKLGAPTPTTEMILLTKVAGVNTKQFTIRYTLNTNTLIFHTGISQINSVLPSSIMRKWTSVMFNQDAAGNTKASVYYANGGTMSIQIKSLGTNKNLVTDTQFYTTLDTNLKEWRCKIRSLKLVTNHDLNNQEQDYLTYIEAGYKYNYDYIIDFKTINRLFATTEDSVAQIYLDTSAVNGNIMQSDFIVGAHDCGEWGVFNPTYEMCEDVHVHDYFNIDHVYEIDTSGVTYQGETVISCWVQYLANSGFNAAVYKFNGIGAQVKDALKVKISGANVQFTYEYNVVSTQNITGTVPQQRCMYTNWCFISTLRQDPGNVELYIMWEQITTQAAVAGNQLTASSVMWIGGDSQMPGLTWFKGRIDHFKLTTGPIGFLTQQVKNDIFMNRNDRLSSLHFLIYYSPFIERTIIKNFAGLSTNRELACEIFAQLTYYEPLAAADYEIRKHHMHMVTPVVQHRVKETTAPGQSFVYTAKATSTDWLIEFVCSSKTVAANSKIIDMSGMFLVKLDGTLNAEIKDFGDTTVIKNVPTVWQNNMVYHILITKNNFLVGTGTGTAHGTPLPDIINTTPYTFTIYSDTIVQDLKIWNDPEINLIFQFNFWNPKNIFEPNRYREQLMLYFPNLLNDHLGGISRWDQAYPLWMDRQWDTYAFMPKPVSGNSATYGQRYCTTPGIFNGLGCYPLERAFIMGGQHIQQFTVTMPQASWGDATWAFEAYYFINPGSSVNIVQFKDAGATVTGTLTYNLGATSLQINATSVSTPLTFATGSETSWIHYLFAFNSIAPQVQHYKQGSYNKNTTMTAVPLPKTMTFMHANLGLFTMRGLMIWDNIDVLYTYSIDYKRFRGFALGTANLLRYFPLVEQSGYEILDEATSSVYNIYDMIDRTATNFAPGYLLDQIQFNLEPFKFCPKFSGWDFIWQWCSSGERVMPVSQINSNGGGSPTYHTLPTEVQNTYSHSSSLGIGLWAKVNLASGGPTTHPVVSFEGANLAGREVMVYASYLTTLTALFEYRKRSDSSLVSTQASVNTVALNNWAYYQTQTFHQSGGTVFRSTFGETQIADQTDANKYFWCTSCGITFLKKPAGLISATGVFREVRIFTSTQSTINHYIHMTTKHQAMGLNIVYNIEFFGEWIRDVRSNLVTYVDQTTQPYYQIETGSSINDRFMMCPFGSRRDFVSERCDNEYKSEIMNLAGDYISWDETTAELANLRDDKDREWAFFYAVDIIGAPVATGPIFEIVDIATIDLSTTLQLTVTYKLSDASTPSFNIPGIATGLNKLLFMFRLKTLLVYNFNTLLHTETIAAPYLFTTPGAYRVSSTTDQPNLRVESVQLFYPLPGINQLSMYFNNDFEWSSPEISRISSIRASYQASQSVYKDIEQTTIPAFVSNVAQGKHQAKGVCRDNQFRLTGEDCVPIGSLATLGAQLTLDLSTTQQVKFDNTLTIAIWVNLAQVQASVTGYVDIVVVTPVTNLQVKYNAVGLFDLRQRFFAIGSLAPTDNDQTGKTMNQWYHVAVTVGNQDADGATVEGKYYLDGALAATSPMNGAAGQSYQATNVDIKIGRVATDVYSKFQHVILYGRKLDHGEIEDLMTEEPDVVLNRVVLLAYYRLIEMPSQTIRDYSFQDRSVSIAAEATANTVMWDRHETALMGPSGTFTNFEASGSTKSFIHKHHYLTMHHDDPTVEDNLGTISLSGEVTIAFLMRVEDGTNPIAMRRMKILSLDTNHKHLISRSGPEKQLVFEHDSQSINVDYVETTSLKWAAVVTSVSNVVYQKMYVGRVSERVPKYSEITYVPSSTLPTTPSILLGRDAVETPNTGLSVSISELKIFSKYLPFSYVLKYISMRHVNKIDFGFMIAYFKFDKLRLQVANTAVEPPTLHTITRTYTSLDQTIDQHLVCKGDTYAVVPNAMTRGYCQNKRRYLGFQGPLLAQPLASTGQDATFIFWTLFLQTDLLKSERLVVQMSNTWKAVLDSTQDYHADVLPAGTQMIASVTTTPQTKKWVAVAIRVFAPAMLFSMSTSKVANVWVTETRFEDQFGYPNPQIVNWATTNNETLSIFSEAGNWVYLREVLYYNHYMTVDYLKFIMNSGVTNPPEDKLSLLHYFKIDESGGYMIHDEAFVTEVPSSPISTELMIASTIQWSYWDEVTNDVEPAYLYCMRGVGQNRKFTNYCIRDLKTELCAHCPDPDLKLCNGPNVGDCFGKPPLNVYDPVKKAFIECHPACPGACTAGLDINACTCPTGYAFNVTTRTCIPTFDDPTTCLVGTFYDFVSKRCVTVPQISGTLSPKPQCRKQNLTAKISQFDVDKEFALIEFSSDLQDPITPLLKTMITLHIKGPFEPYHIHPNHTLNFINNRTINMTWHLYGPQLIGQETFIMTINDPNRFYTFFECLSPEKYQLIKSLKSVVVTQDEEDAKTIAQYLGFGGIFGTMGFFGFSFILKLCSDLIWSFVNSMQIIRLMPMWIPYLPPHVIALLDAFEFVSLDFGFFRDLWALMPNIDLLALFDEQFSDDYSIYELESTKVLKNCAGIFLSGMVTVLSFFLIAIMTRLTRRCRKLNKYFSDSYGGFFYNSPIRFVIEVYLDFLLFSSINLFTLSKVNFMESSSSFISIYGVMLLSFFPFCLVYMIWKYQTLIIDKDEAFRSKYSVLFEDLNTSVYYTIQFYPIFLLRRTIYVFLISGISGQLSAQFSVFIFKAAATYAYHMKAKPYLRPPVNFIMAINEIFIITLGAIAGSMLEQNWSYKQTSGWVFNAVLLFQLVFNIVFVVSYAFYELWLRYRKKRKEKIQVNMSITNEKLIEPDTMPAEISQLPIETKPRPKKKRRQEKKERYKQPKYFNFPLGPEGNVPAKKNALNMDVIKTNDYMKPIYGPKGNALINPFSVPQRDFLKAEVVPDPVAPPPIDRSHIDQNRRFFMRSDKEDLF